MYATVWQDVCVTFFIYSFAAAAKSLVKETKVFHISDKDVKNYQAKNPFKGSCDVKGISKIHLMAVNSHQSRFWRLVRYIFIMTRLRGDASEVCE